MTSKQIAIPYIKTERIVQNMLRISLFRHWILKLGKDSYFHLMNDHDNLKDKYIIPSFENMG